MTRSRKFPNDPTSVRAARRFVLGELPGRSPQILQIVELLVSELAGNCVRHTDSEFEVRVSVDEQRVRVSVTDHAAGWPVVRHVEPTSLTGRGLALVETLSDSWGVHSSRSAAGGKCVWFVLSLEREVQPTRQAQLVA